MHQYLRQRVLLEAARPVQLLSSCLNAKDSVGGAQGVVTLTGNGRHQGWVSIAIYPEPEAALYCRRIRLSSGLKK